MSLITELNRIKTAKKELARAITDKGVEVPADNRLDMYPMYINQIGQSMPVLPDVFYEQNRSPDWMYMPRWFQNELIYLLVHIPKGLKSLIAFSVECTGDYTVEFGTVSGSVFTSLSSNSFASGTVYQNEILADDFPGEGNFYLAQCMIRISGTNITSFQICHHDKIGERHRNWNIVEINANLPNLQTLRVNELKQLIYFNLTGTNKTNLKETSGIFRGCTSLLAVVDFGSSGTLKDASYMYANCTSLVAPARYLTIGDSTSHMFENCYSLTVTDGHYLPTVTDFSSMFENCVSLSSANVSMRNAQNCSRMFYGCQSLKSAYLQEPNATDLSYMFYGCTSLNSTEDVRADSEQLFSKAINLQYMFGKCSRLKEAAFFSIYSSFSNMEGMFADCVSLQEVNLNVGYQQEVNITSTKRMFENCHSLQHIYMIVNYQSSLNFGKATDVSNMFHSCQCLRSLDNLDVGQARLTDGIFEGCLSLGELTFNKSAIDWKSNISLADGILSYPAIIRLLESLPNTSGAKLDLSGNPGTSELTDTDKSIAINKGWELTI